MSETATLRAALAGAKEATNLVKEEAEDRRAPYREAFAHVTALMKEYTGKLTEVCRRVTDLHARWHHVATTGPWLLRLGSPSASARVYRQVLIEEHKMHRRIISESQRPLEDLVRQGSALLEGGATERTDKIELSLRLAEALATLDAVTQALEYDLGGR